MPNYIWNVFVNCQKNFEERNRFCYFNVRVNYLSTMVFEETLRWHCSFPAYVALHIHLTRVQFYLKPWDAVEFQGCTDGCWEYVHACFHLSLPDSLFISDLSRRTLLVRKMLTCHSHSLFSFWLVDSCPQNWFTSARSLSRKGESERMTTCHLERKVILHSRFDIDLSKWSYWHWTEET